MRAKKSILLYCADSELLSTTAFALRLHNYDVAAIDEVKEAMALAGGDGVAVACGVLIHAQQGDPTGRLVHLLLQHTAHIPLLLVDRVGDLAPVRYADIVLYGRNTKMVHVLAALELLHRKRQPQPRKAL